MKAADSMHFIHYNFVRIHQILRVTPAMQAGVASHIWTWGEFLGVVKTSKKAA